MPMQRASSPSVGSRSTLPSGNTTTASPGAAPYCWCSAAASASDSMSSVWLGSPLRSVDGTMVNIALPAIQADLGASVYEAQWVVEAYLCSSPRCC